jgi:hypothetical protein
MRLHRLPALLLAAALAMSGCATDTITTSVTVEAVDAAAELATLDQTYRQARDDLLKHQAALPPEVAAEVTPLIEDTDAYAERLRTLWRTDKALMFDQAERLFIEGQALYQRGVDLIAPHLDTLPPVARYDLRALADSLADIDRAVDYYQANPQAAQRAQLYGNGLRLAIALLRIGGVALGR